MQTRSRSVALVLFDEVELLDFAGPVQAFSMAGREWNFRPFKIQTVARRTGCIETRNQLKVHADHTFSTCAEANVILVPGGYGARVSLADSELVGWLAEHGQRAELVLSIGHGALLVAKAGLCDGAEIAVSADAQELLAEVSTTHVPNTTARVVSAGKFLSTSSSVVGIDLALAAISRLLSAKMAVGVAAKLGHVWSPDAGAPEPLHVEIVDP